jgi:hypothetical protein
MYTAFYILHIAAFFLTASWFIGITWITGLTLIVIIRVRREESMMIRRFGDDYRNYMKRTRPVFPAARYDQTYPHNALLTMPLAGMNFSQPANSAGGTA